MSPAVTDAMVADMDETAEFMQTRPVFSFAPSGIKHDRPKKEKLFKGLQTIQRRGITVTGREQGEKDSCKRDALVRGGI